MQSTRIVHFIERLDGYGTAEPLRVLAVEQVNAGHQVRVAALECDRGTAARLRERGVQVLTAERRWPIDPIAILRAARWLRGPCDRVHAWGAKAIVLAAWLTKPDAESLATLGLPLPHSRRASLRLARACGQFGCVKPIDKPTERWLSESAIGVGEIQVALRNVAEWRASAKSRDELLADWGLDVDRPLVVTAGPLIRPRKLDDAIWNFELIRVLHRRAQMIVVGDGPDRARLERFARLVSEPGCVAFVGYRDDWRDILPLVDVYWEVAPGAIFPQAVCEALVARTPVVVGRDPRRAELVERGANVNLLDAAGRAEFASKTDRLITNRRAKWGAASADHLATWLAEAGRSAIWHKA